VIPTAQVTALSFALLVACAGQPGSQTTPGAGSEALVDGVVVEVEDGDTFVLGTGEGDLTIRLLGVNAPEHDECGHKEAAAGLSSYLDHGPLQLDSHGVDQFGRTLGYVWAGDSLVNLGLVESGLAIATTPEPEQEEGATLLAAEESAYRAGIGLWDPAGCDGDAGAGIEITIDVSGHNPPGPDDEVLDQEHVALVSSSDGRIDLSGWVLRDESSTHRYRLPPGSALEPDQVLMVTSDHPGWDPGGSPVWNNDGDMALLLSPDGAVVARQRYGPQSVG
jgi:endonuclease YncB( thermonuclease family)